MLQPYLRYDKRFNIRFTIIHYNELSVDESGNQINPLIINHSINQSFTHHYKIPLLQSIKALNKIFSYHRTCRHSNELIQSNKQINQSITINSINKQSYQRSIESSIRFLSISESIKPAVNQSIQTANHSINVVMPC